MKLLHTSAIFVIAYVAFMLPTYVLPYFGSNSALVGAISHGLGFGPLPQWWVHVWCLAMLAMICWVRGAYAGRSYLIVFPILAAIFDMTPVINNIPLVPTVMHLLAIILGVMVKTENAASEDASAALSRRGFTGSIAATAIAVAGIVTFQSSAMIRANQLKSALAERTAPAPVVKAPKPAPAPVAIVPTPVPAPVVASQPVITPPAAPTPPAAVPPAAAKPAAPAPIAAPAPVHVKLKTPAPALVNSTAISGMLDDAKNCYAQKKFDCAIASANSALRLDPSNAAAKDTLQRAQAAQKQALQSISIN